MLGATYPDIEEKLRKAVAFGAARGINPSATTLPAPEESPPLMAASIPSSSLQAPTTTEDTVPAAV